jgi:hypothetical protein
MVLSVELRDARKAAEARMLGIPENVPATIPYENTGRLPQASGMATMTKYFF